VTGGGRGIGAAIVRLAARRGLNVCFSYLRDEAAAQGLAAELEGGGGELHVSIPYSMLEPIREQLDAGVQSDRIEKDEGWTRAMRKQLQDAEVELSSAIARRQISLRELSRLRVGDVIPIELARDVHLLVEQMPLFSGEFGIHNGKNAIKVTQVHSARPTPTLDSLTDTP
jgi:flagellar motor switch protein FliM